MSSDIDKMSYTRYTKVAIALHWLIALGILFNLSIGYFMEGLSAHWRLVLVGLHSSSGMTVLALAIVRLFWRLSHRPPPFPPGMKAWERNMARIVHGFLYSLMLFMPITGWMFLSAHRPRPNGGVHVWGLVTVPHWEWISRLPEPYQKQFHDRWVGYHSIGSFVLLTLLVMHVLGALKHQYLDRQPEFARMGLGRSRRTQRST
jgi:cytochrome b561